MSTTSNELRLIFARSGDALTYRLVTSWGGDAGPAQPFVPFLTHDDFEDLRWYLEDFMILPMGGAEVRAERVERSLAAWGRRLFAAIFDHGDHREVFNALADGDAPRLLTIGSADLDILRLPWELMADARGPLTRRGISVRRQLESPRRPEKYDAGKLPLRVLLAVSRSDDTGFLDPRHTTRAMLEALGPLGAGVVVDFCRPATLARLDRMLTDADRAKQPYHLVHFDGHGTFLPKSQIGALCFEKDEGADGTIAVDMVRADTIGALLSAHKIPLAILEACRSGEMGHVAALSGVAPALLDAGVGSVLSMSHAVHVEATKILLERFYEEIVAGATIGQALEQGRAALIAKPDRWIERGPGGKTVALKDWFLPHLYQRGLDLTLVPGGADHAPRSTTAPAVRRKPAQDSEPGAFPDKPIYGFHGRAAELHTIERRFLKHRTVLLHAMGGMGKTSLAREGAYWWTAPTGLFPDGACFVSFEQPGGAQRAVQVVGAYFEGAEFEQRSAEEQKKQARELFQTKKVLVVWDNFESVLPAFQGGEGAELYSDEERQEVYKLFRDWTGEDKGYGRLLVTCRPGDTGLGTLCKVELGGLAQPDALSLLYRVMMQEGIAGKYDRDDLIGLVKALENHPLSVQLVGPHLKDMKPAKIVEDFKVLLDKFKGDADVERNRSLLASLEFSLKRLSKEARDAVRWLGLFRGGVFEHILLRVSQIEPGAWDKARGELEATALVRVEREVMLADKPYLRFHPTLAYATADGVAEPEVRQRYVEVYLAVRGAVDKALFGSNPRGGMDVMVREEANFRTAVSWALAEGAYDRASWMGNTLREYLMRSGRLRERDRWVEWLAGEVGKGGFSAAVAYRERDAAMALLSQGKAKEAIEKLEALVERLKHRTDFDAAGVLADASTNLGRVYGLVGWSQKAIPVLEDAVKQWEAMVEKARAAGESAEDERGNLAATLGDLANDLRNAGKLDKAMEAANRHNVIVGELGRNRDVAAGLGRTAQILMKQGRFAEADARYEEALQAARRAGDRELEGSLLQHQGSLADERQQYDRATQLYQRALQLFQDMHNDGSVMRTCNPLGLVEQNAGRLAEARAWYERSRELAERRKDDKAKGTAAQNLGIVCQLEGEAARAKGDEARARERFIEAARFVGESLAVWMESKDEPHQADSHGQLTWIHLLLGDLDKAETEAHRARDIYERLGLRDAWKVYQLLATIARARNNAPEAAAWEQKRDALRAELRRRAGAPALPPQAIQEIGQLALACARAGLSQEPLGADLEESLATLATWPPPLDALPPFCRALAQAELPAVPPGLPKELGAVLEQVREAVKEARKRG